MNGKKCKASGKIIYDSYEKAQYQTEADEAEKDLDLLFGGEE